MRFELVFLDALDPSLGRVDLESLPQQALMEMVIEGIANKEKICGNPDEPKDIEEWKGVTVEDDEVVDIDWQRRKLEGSLYLEWLPSTVRGFTVTWNLFTGTLNLASLPRSIKNLYLGFNAFTDPTKGHLSVVGWTSTPVLGEAKNLFKPLVVFLSWRRPY
ncbi:hypothetical protein XU18_3209 [Perkinsela sp. CCAP 1560/4]|nr:hypothetical protein XU18_3209 [Perkinsela sp. CCAP 1560/4]|eukprot:KNH05798.1 hypothetical protein XU18_3209 [Perkinsela sp. CCAP 1560/4]